MADNKHERGTKWSDMVAHEPIPVIEETDLPTPNTPHTAEQLPPKLPRPYHKKR